MCCAWQGQPAPDEGEEERFSYMRVAAEEVKKAEEKELRRNKDMDEYLEKRRKGEIRPNDQVGCQASPCNPETPAFVAASDTQCLPLHLGPAISSPLPYLLSSPSFT